ncbi:endonuclease [Sphingomonas sp. MM-1]|uniref:DNA/RNA non-specific endonuclease n=1 Tax=Sphingomonas sp. MM-1 TaxID=745310 RepID=UPI0002C131A3|nr:DNA/RNA non-specific endonuclease [Sphingomonas sp. MM-1]AGH50166.1 endonuclease [Sphingomonas sp. MM-1]
MIRTSRLTARIAGAAAFLVGLATPFAAAAQSRASELHTFHCLQGCPIGAPATNDIVVREIYTLSSNDLTKLADWVAYRVTREGIGVSGDRDWRRDPWLSSDETLTPDAYDGASGALHIDRGHQAPLSSFSGTPHAADTNILSNITPQSSALNQGPWVRLEDRERALATRLGVPVYVYTGPLFERMMKPLPTGGPYQRVPSGYWKVVALADGRATAFVFDQAAARRSDYCDARVSLLHVELRSRLVLFPRATVPFASLDTELGCGEPAPADPTPDEIPPERPATRRGR